MSKKVLIIGGSGLLGSYLTKWCIKQGYTDMTATYQNSADDIHPLLKEGIHWKQLVLPDKEKTLELIKGHDCVIHTAGFVSYNPKHKSRLMDINSLGTSQIVNACLEHNVKHLIFIGSKSVLGREKENEPITETAPWLENKFSTHYGLSKYLGELEVWRGAAEGLPVSVVLPSIILGTGNWDRSSLQMIKRIATKSKWYPGGTTGFVDVRDVVSFIGILVESGPTGERWLLNGFNKSYAAMYHDFGEQLNIQATYKEAPKWLAKLILSGKSLFGESTLGVEMLHQAYGSFSYDSTKSLGLEGFQYTDPKKTIYEIVKSYHGQKNQFLPGS